MTKDEGLAMTTPFVSLRGTIVPKQSPLRGVKEAPIYQDSRLEIEEIPNLKHQIPSIQPSAFIFLVCSEVDGWLLTTDY